MQLTWKTISFYITLIVLSFHTNAQTATIDLATEHQYVRGFGGMNMPGWIPDLTIAQAHKAFDVGKDRIGLSVLRIRVPADPNYFYKEYPTVQTARSFGVTIFATPWSPPASMKTNNSTVRGSLKTSAYGDYAAYLKSFADYMNSKSAPLYAISLQNEPDWLPDYESCGWTADQFVSFLRGYGSEVGNNLIVAESLNLNHAITDPILNDSVASSKIAIIGGHLYGSGLKSYPLAKQKGKELWMTEHITDTDSAYIWSGAMKLGKEINDCMIAGFNVYTWWYIRRFYGLIDESGAITKRGYVMSQFSRFIRPGYIRVSTSTTADNVDITAYHKGNNVVVVALNRNSTAFPLNFTFQNENVPELTRYTTTATKNVKLDSTFKISGNAFTTNLDAMSITTFVYRDSLNMVPDANAETDHIINDTDSNGSESVTLNASGSTDADGKIISYLWTENGDTIATGITPSVIFTAGIHKVALIVSDDSASISTDSVNVLVNNPPLADAGPGQEVTDNDNTGNEQITLDGTGSSDMDGKIVSYTWTENGNLLANGANPVVAIVPGTHTITLTVTDNHNASATSTVTITVNPFPNIAPIANAGPDFEVIDSTNSGSVEVALDGSASSDEDGSIAYWIWSENGGRISTGEHTTVNLPVGVHTIELMVGDNAGAKDRDSVTITVSEYVGIQSINNMQSLEVNLFPNPFGNQANLQFSLEKSTSVKLNITDISGRVIKTLDEGVQPAGKCNLLINRSGLKNGMYYCRIIAGEKQKVIRFMVNGGR